MQTKPLSLAGRLAQSFLNYKVTPILMMLSLLLGAFALYFTPAEEDPQIPITMVHITTQFPGATALEVETRVTMPIENFLSKISGIKHIYSTSATAQSTISLEFHLGEYNTQSVFKAHEMINENIGRLPIGIKKPVISAMEIDDVPSLVYSLYSQNNEHSRVELKHFAQSLKVALSQVQNIRSIDVVTGVKPAVRVILHPQKMALLKITSNQIKEKIKSRNSSIPILNQTTTEPS